MTMAELHDAVASALSWSMSDGPNPSRIRRVVVEKLLLSSNSANLQSSDCDFCTNSRTEYYPLPGQIGTLCTVQRLLQMHGLNRHLTYDYDITRYPHASGFLGTSDRDGQRKLTCLV